MDFLLSTPRLLLREFSPSDAAAMYSLNSDPEVIRYTGDAPFESVQAAKTFLKSYNEYQNNGYGRWAVVLKESGAFIGWCGLKLNEENLVDLGFRFFPYLADCSFLYGFSIFEITTGHIPIALAGSNGPATQQNLVLPNR